MVLSGYMSVRQQRISAKLRKEENRREKQESALAAAQRVYEPMAQAAAELQSRIYNIVENDWVTLTKRYEGHGDYPTKSTAFLFAHYFGWIEARRQSVLDSSGKGGRDDTVQNLIDGVTKIMRRGDDSEGFSFFSAEQRAIGELMFYLGGRARQWPAHSARARICGVLDALQGRPGVSQVVQPRSTPVWRGSPRATTADSSTSRARWST